MQQRPTLLANGNPIDFTYNIQQIWCLLHRQTIWTVSIQVIIKYIDNEIVGELTVDRIVESTLCRSGRRQSGGQVILHSNNYSHFIHSMWVNFFLNFLSFYRIESYSCKMVGDEKHKYKKFYSQSGTQPGDLEALGCSPNSDPRYGRRYKK